jgi:hypothetical protein
MLLLWIDFVHSPPLSPRSGRLSFSYLVVLPKRGDKYPVKCLITRLSSRIHLPWDHCLPNMPPHLLYAG